MTRAGSIVALALVRVITATLDPAEAAETLPARPPTTVRLTVTANDTNVYGTPWDGVRMGTIVGAFMPELPTSSPPDIAICVVEISTGQPAMDCHHQGSEAKPISLCHDSFECTFDATVPSTGAFGIVVYDIDNGLGEGRNDLVDVFLVAEGGERLEEVEEATRAAVKLISRTDADVPDFMRNWLKRDRVTIKPNEELRRSSPYKVFGRGECAKVACRLSQSQIVIDWQR